MNQETQPSSAEVRATTELLREMHRNVTMGSETLAMVVPKITGQRLLTDVTGQMEHYGDFTTRTEELLSKRNRTAKNTSLMKKAMTKMGIAMNTAADSSDSNIAAMIGKGTMTGLTSLTGTMHRMHQADEETKKLCREIIDFEKAGAMGVLEYT